MIDISVVGYEHEDLRTRAKILAKRLNFSLDKDASRCLFVTAHKLSLKIPGFSLLCSELDTALWNKRRSEGKKPGLIRACKPCAGLRIIDATAGFGRDAAVLSGFGAEVLMIERHPIMASLLADALQRSKGTTHLSLHSGDAYAFLSALKEQEYPDVIYIDPMHPQRGKSALVKKEMQVLQKIIGVEKDTQRLIELAINCVRQRVVVKWPQKIKPLLPANACVEGKTVRFDIYPRNLE